MGFFKDLGRAIKGTVTHAFANPLSGGQNASLSHNFRVNREARNKKNRIDANEAEQIAAETSMSDEANLQLAASRRRRRLSSLFAGGRSVLGAPGGRGAPGGGGSPVTSSAVAGGSAMGGGARSYGGRSIGGGRSSAYGAALQ